MHLISFENASEADFFNILKCVENNWSLFLLYGEQQNIELNDWR